MAEFVFLMWRRSSDVCVISPQVHDMAECIGNRQARYLRFTLYTRDVGGGVVEIVNTGLMEVACMTLGDSGQSSVSSGQGLTMMQRLIGSVCCELVIHFGANVSLESVPFNFIALSKAMQVIPDDV